MDIEAIDFEDVLAWADGVVGALGTEHATKVPDVEARVAQAILAAAKSEQG